MLSLYQSLDTKSVILSLLLATFVYWIVTAIYRVTLHPLAKIPGPKIAAITQLYQTYHCHANGHSRFYEVVGLLHDKYGPVVRITPNEVSLSDPDNYEKIYYQSTKYYKPSEFYGAFKAPVSAFTTSSNELHRVRRGALNSMFSRKSVLSLENIVQNIVAKLCDHLAKGFEEGKEENIHYAFRAVSIDTISDYAFDDCFQLIDKENFGGSFSKMIESITAPMFFFMQFPLLHTIAFNTPKWANPSSNVRIFLNFLDEIRVKVTDIKTHLDPERYKKDSRTTIFYELLNPRATQGHVVPSVDRMVDDAFIMLGAASDTTGNAMTVATYHILKNPEIYSRLREELTQTFPDPNSRLDFLTLEKLPYLTGVVKEGLRLSFGVPGRLPRVVPSPGAEFNGYAIPPGMVVGMSSWIMHRNPKIFPSPLTFDPTRWLDPKEAQYLEKYLVSFGKGNRQCLGMPLAYVEIYVTLGTLFFRFPDLRPNDIKDEDFRSYDLFSSFPEPNATLLHCHRAT